MVRKISEDKVILLVEDNPDDVELTLRAMKKNNINNEIVVLSDGEEVLNYLFYKDEYKDRSKNKTPGLILLDLKLPKIDGLEVLKELRKHESTKYIPVVMLTTSDEGDDIVNSYKNGANSYVRKPVDFEEFHNAVKQLGLYWFFINESPPDNKEIG